MFYKVNRKEEKIKRNLAYLLVLVIVFSTMIGSTALAYGNDEIIISQTQKRIWVERYFTHKPSLYIDYCDSGWGGRLERYYYGYSDSTGLYKGLYTGIVYDGGCPYSLPLELE